MTFKLAVGAKMGHPGPTLAYMSAAGSDVKSYKGDGDWFKIMEEGVCNASGDFTKDAWCNYDAPSFDVKIPQGTPNGEYLLRVEHIGIHRSHVNQPEHYVSCAQVKVTGGSDGTVDAEMVKFPGAYKDTDEYANFSIYGGAKAFPMPGPKVWDGAASAGGSTGGNTEAPAAGNTEAPASTPVLRYATARVTVSVSAHTKVLTSNVLYVLTMVHPVVRSRSSHKLQRQFHISRKHVRRAKQNSLGHLGIHSCSEDQFIWFDNMQ
ncbi:Putative endo-beta-1,4-glucanase D [Fusarium odoratissimum]|uniref:lytic cellulose monooxygenase (C4-dehydrogenating) n=1 Tax=Fusarium oxysporum f. sp. cubense (strain race 4) TaxID=2502994 RepID=N1S3L1_FUSC4|nr:Putative endo-beta-1,4-glucanase D [Fusarium odoratissimum]